jgi:hypothetical protein
LRRGRLDRQFGSGRYDVRVGDVGQVGPEIVVMVTDPMSSDEISNSDLQKLNMMKWARDEQGYRIGSGDGTVIKLSLSDLTSVYLCSHPFSQVRRILALQYDLSIKG